MIYKKPPENFIARFEVVSCYVEHQGEIVLLHRNVGKSQGNRWGVPAGKVKPDEPLNVAMSRELKEETGIEIDPTQFEYVDKAFIKHAGYQFIYHTFATSFLAKPEVRINPEEHQRYRWVGLSDALMMNLVEDLDECIRRFCSTKSEVKLAA